MINRRLSLRSQLCAAQAFLAADGLSVERAFNRAFPLDREHKRLDGAITIRRLSFRQENASRTLVEKARFQRILARMLDESEFLSPYGLRSLSRYH